MGESKTGIWVQVTISFIYYTFIVRANTLKSTVCKGWIHKRYSGVHGNLSLVVDGFRCKRSDGTIQEADLTKDIVMDG